MAAHEVLSPTSMRPYLRAVGVGPHSNHDLTRDEARDAMTQLLDGRATRVQAAAFLIGMRLKGETPEELAGFVEAVRAFADTIAPRVEGLVDIGSPYDGRTESWVLSPAASIVAAAAGTPIVMHGDVHIGPKYGVTVTDVLAAMGVSVDAAPHVVEASLEELGFGFMRASRFVPALYALRGVRQELMLRSAINTVEKLYDLANARRHLIGLTHRPYAERFVGAVRLLGAERTLLVQGIEGTEDATTARPTRTIEVKGGEQTETLLDPAPLGVAPLDREALVMPADPRAHAARNESALSPDGPPADQDAIALNAALRVRLGEPRLTLPEALERTRSAIASGRAARLLAELRRCADSSP